MHSHIFRIEANHRADPERPASLLHPSAGLSLLVGRDHERKFLFDFCRHAAPFRWLSLFGDGGVGKTRLALEAARELAGAQWQAGFIPGDALDRWVGGDDFASWTPTADTFLIVDNAARKSDAVESLLVRFAQWGARQEEGKAHPRLRLVLIERRAAASAGWLGELLRAVGGPRLKAVHDTMESPLRLDAPGRSDPDGAMVQILRAAMRGWENLTGKKAPDLRPPSPAALQALRRNTDRNPVFLQLAAIRACETQSTLNLSEWSQADLLQYAVSRERACLRSRLGSLGNPEAVERGVAFLSIAGARTPGDKPFAALLAADAEALGIGAGAAPSTLQGLAAVVGKQGETKRNIFIPIAHDLVSGAFAATVLGERRPLLDETIGRVLDVQPDVGWLNLLRITGDLCGIAGFDLTRNWLDMVLAERPVEELEWLSSQLAVRTPQLASFGAALQEILVLRMPQTPEYGPLRAETMNRLAVCNAELGRRTAALETSRRAAEAFEKIATENPSWRSAWSDSLNNLAAFQAMVGQHAAAAETGRRVVELREGLAKEDPERHRARLAGAWGNLGICLVESGEGEEGLAAVTRAAAIWEELARENPDAFGPGFAQILNNLGALNGRRRRWRDALAPCERAVGYLRGLADRNPDIFEPELAAALTNLSNALAGMGRSEPAMREASEAVFLFEKLSHRNPDAWENDLAMALVNLAAHCRRAGKAGDAARHAREALAICERRAGRDRRSGGHLGAALANLGAAADPRSQADQALMAAGKAVEVYEGLYKAQPETYRADMAAALLLQGRLQSEMGLREPGLQNVTRAMEFFTFLAEKDPASNEAALAGAYGVLARVLQLSGDGEKARGAYRRGIEILQRGFDRDPAGNAEIAATLIQGYVKHCDAAGKRPSPEALAPYEEALRRMAAKGGGGARA